MRDRKKRDQSRVAGSLRLLRLALVTRRLLSLILTSNAALKIRVLVSVTLVSTPATGSITIRNLLEE